MPPLLAPARQRRLRQFRNVRADRCDPDRGRPVRRRAATCARPSSHVRRHCSGGGVMRLYGGGIADVDPATWQLDPERVAARVDLKEVGIVIPVAPFGRAVPHTAWLEFRERTGIPVEIDGAATFEAATQPGPQRILGELPVVMSFHATKAFATGEGGCVSSTDPGVVEQVGQALNFGFSGSQDSATPSLNGKLSEYHAAIGLAELEQWNAKQEAMARVLEVYRVRFDRLGLADRLVCGPEVASPYVLFRARSQLEANDVAASLAGRRRWTPSLVRKRPTGTYALHRPLGVPTPRDGGARASPARASLCRRSRGAGC